MKPPKHLTLVGGAPSTEAGETADGRRQRSERSRAQIVDAMMELVRGGDMNPSAARVAEQAGVSLRTVFRHFEEMDSLYREMTARLEEEILPLALKPFEAADWRGRLGELVTRRAQIFELMLPFRVAGNVRRFQSEHLMDDYRRSILMERAALHGVLPKAALADAPRAAALEIATGFQTWRRLRQDMGLTPTQAEAAMRFTVERLAGDL
jgi:AcrR family transcriptional regulator